MAINRFMSSILNIYCNNHFIFHRKGVSIKESSQRNRSKPIFKSKIKPEPEQNLNNVDANIVFDDSDASNHSIAINSCESDTSRNLSNDNESLISVDQNQAYDSDVAENESDISLPNNQTYESDMSNSNADDSETSNHDDLSSEHGSASLSAVDSDTDNSIKYVQSLSCNLLLHVPYYFIDRKAKIILFISAHIFFFFFLH